MSVHRCATLMLFLACSGAIPTFKHEHKAFPHVRPLVMRSEKQALMEIDIDSGGQQALGSLIDGSARSVQLQRADAIRSAAKHVWSNYRQHAWGADQLRPIAGEAAETDFRHAVTMVDSLDTLWIMGLKDEFADAKSWLVENLPARIEQMPPSASLFETTIRTLGGLLGAYDLSRDEAFLDMAIPLGRRIVATIDERGVAPYTFGGGMGGMGCASLAESGTLQLELRYLAHVTGDESFTRRTNRFHETLRGARGIDGLFPNCWQAGNGKITFGADGDSFYEYLLKMWVQGGGKDDKLRAMYEAAVDGMEKHLVHIGNESIGQDPLTFLGTMHWSGRSGEGDVKESEMEHLACFVPGWLALGMRDHPDGARQKRLTKLAEDLAYTCWQMYQRQPTGIGPERVKGMKMDLSLTDTREYILRPEAVEGWFYLHELAPHPKYREWGWETFMNFEKHLRAEHGYASIKDVRSTPPHQMDRMESFFMAETLKYLFLLQDPDHDIHLDKYVFNTEAHPLSILSRAPVRGGAV